MFWINMFPMFPSGTIIRTDVLFPGLPGTNVAPIRPLGDYAPTPNQIPPQETASVKGKIIDANPKAIRVSYKWPNGKVVNPIIPGDNTYVAGDDVVVIIKSTQPYTFVRLVKKA